MPGIRMISYSILLMTSVYLFLSPLEQMQHEKLRNAMINLSGTGILILLRVSLPNLTADPAILFFVRFIVVLICVELCFREVSWTVLYCSIWPMMIFYCVSIVGESMVHFLGVHLENAGTQLLFLLCIFAVSYTLLTITIFHWMPRNGKYQAGPRRTVSALMVLLLSQCSNYFYYESADSSILAVLVQIYCVTFLYLQAELFKQSEMKEELNLMEQLWYQQKKQYEIAKEQMQLIDRKCHDLKYQVAAMRHIENPAEREKNLTELEKSIRIYDAIVKTGNEILDTLLSEKSLICEAREITMHCVIDGEKLDFMNPVDIYALFGNAIDNAIECVKKFKEHEKRFIDVCVMEKQHFLYIRISNPISETLEYEGDLPKTTKMNKQYHGLGLKSIRHIATKYNGDITVEVEMNCFLLEILLPLTTYVKKTTN